MKRTIRQQNYSNGSAWYGDTRTPQRRAVEALVGLAGQFLDDVVIVKAPGSGWTGSKGAWITRNGTVDITTLKSPSTGCGSFTKGC